MYFVGAVSLWIAIRNRGFPADIAIEHQPRGALVGIGVRGGLALLGITAFLLLGSYVCTLFETVRKLAQRVTLLRACVTAGVLVLAASFFSWRWVAIAVIASTILLQNAAHWHLPRSWRLRGRAYWLAVLASATVTTIAWVAGGELRVPAVDVTPRSATPVLWLNWTRDECAAGSTRLAQVGGKRIPVSEHNDCKVPGARRTAALIRELQNVCAVPYFGETDSLVYVGGIKNVLGTEDSGCRWDAGSIVELRRDEVKLAFRPEKIFLAPSRRRPISTAIDVVSSFFGGIDGRLLPERRD